jgi:uncharacterized protein (TIGR02646 family)
MIKISKPSDAPAVLKNDGRPETERLKRQYDEEPSEFRFFVQSETGLFKRQIYSHPSVRKRLLSCQSKKCCYCEKKSEHVHEVEHYRPKKSVRQSAGDPLEYPGYYWLAYDWDNLLTACRHCNGRKGTLFPLSDPEQRVRSHHGDVGIEDPLLIHPAEEDPAEHISFRKHVAFPKTEKGEVTINVLGLNRPNLTQDRSDRYETLKVLHDLANLQMSSSQKAAEMLREKKSDDEPFAAMVRAAFPDV